AASRMAIAARIGTRTRKCAKAREIQNNKGDTAEIAKPPRKPTHHASSFVMKGKSADSLKIASARLPPPNPQSRMNSNPPMPLSQPVFEPRWGEEFQMVSSL